MKARNITHCTNLDIAAPKLLQRARADICGGSLTYRNGNFADATVCAFARVTAAAPPRLRSLAARTRARTQRKKSLSSARAYLSQRRRRRVSRIAIERKFEVRENGQEVRGGARGARNLKTR
jgi:hypothetical protein